MIKDAIGVIAIVCLLFLFFVLGLEIGEKPKPQEAAHDHVMRTYAIKIDDTSMEIQADSIEQNNGCILLKRGQRTDTIICVGMGKIMVTEKN